MLLSPLRYVKVTGARGRYALNHIPLSQHAFMQDADKLKHTLGA